MEYPCRKVIYWLTRKPINIARIKARYYIHGTSINGESIAYVRDADEYELLRECERRGLIKIRNKPA